MALPSSGSLSFAQIRAELNGSGAISLGDSNVRSLAGKSSGAISFSDLRGRSNLVSGSFSSSFPTTNNLNVVYLNGGTKSIDIISTTAKIKTLTASLSWSALAGQVQVPVTAPSLLFEVVRRSDGAVLSSEAAKTTTAATSSGTLTINFSADTPVAVYLRVTYSPGSGRYYNQPRPIHMVSDGIISGSCTYQP